MNKLAEFQAKLKAPKGQFNAFGKYKYRSAEDILEAVKPIINSEGWHLIISDEIVQIGERYYVKATATLSNEDPEAPLHQSVAYAREEESKKGMDGSQVTGASSSYARKYALNGLFAIDDTKDSDTTNVSDNAPEEPKKAEPKEKKREALTEDHPNFYKVVEYLKGDGMMTEVLKKYTIDKKTEQLLIDKTLE